jgi:hypothetical protein
MGLALGLISFGLAAPGEAQSLDPNIVPSPTAGFYRNYAANNPSPTITRCFDVASSSTSNGGGACNTAFVGTIDMPSVLAKWRFIGRGLGFGQ